MAALGAIFIGSLVIALAASLIRKIRKELASPNRSGPELFVLFLAFPLGIGPIAAVAAVVAMSFLDLLWSDRPELSCWRSWLPSSVLAEPRPRPPESRSSSFSFSSFCSQCHCSPGGGGLRRYEIGLTLMLVNYLCLQWLTQAKPLARGDGDGQATAGD